MGPLFIAKAGLTVNERTPRPEKATAGSVRPPVVNVLALSGGGADGAFGAGLLVGWSAHGGRPEFQVVTGVSAGAIIAPLAYLGRRHDRLTLTAA